MISPILYLAYNRPDLTERTFNVVRTARVQRLFVAVDGPNPNTEDIESCEKVRSIVTNIDWDCEVKYLFRHQNLGCKVAVESALDWFFSNVEKGLVLEDDCLADPSFFDFATELLNVLEDWEDVSMISGFNFRERMGIDYSYRFGRIFPIWGWATWRKNWMMYNSSMNDWDHFVQSGVINCYGNEAERQLIIFEKEYENPDDRTWGVQWRYRNLALNKVCAIPNVSLIQNIGFGHRKAVRQKTFHPLITRDPSAMNDIKHPTHLEIDSKSDEDALNYYYSNKPTK